MKKLISFVKPWFPARIKDAVYATLYGGSYREAKRVEMLLNGTNVKSCDTETVVSRYQRDRLRGLLEHATNNVPYYSNRFASNVPEDVMAFLLEFPILKKCNIKESYEELRATKNKGPYFRFNTGGSMGEPLDFEVSRTNGLVDRVHQEYFFKKLGYESGDKIVAFDGTSVTEEERSRNIYYRRSSNDDIPYGSVHYSSMYLNDETWRYYAGHLSKIRPAFIKGYPSSIANLAGHLVRNSWSIDYKVKAVQLTAEQAYDWQRDLIRKAFGAPVCLQYGHSELSVYAHTDADRTQYLCSPYYGIVEIINPDTLKHVGAGEQGEIVVTALHNFAMPFIRYNTEDVATYGGCENGWPLLTEFLGRSQDFIYRRDGSRTSITALIHGGHLKAFSHIKKWQIVQKRAGEVQVKIIRERSFSDFDAQEIIGKFSSEGINADIQIVSEIPLTARGKHRFVVADIADEEAAINLA